MKPLSISFGLTVMGFCLSTGVYLSGDEKSTVQRDVPETIRGAIYVPSSAYNAPQMWKNFNVEETRRDFGYAREIHLNALRVWASYEYWEMEPGKFKTAFDQMLSVADKDGIRILISLFEHNGVPPTPQNMWTEDPALAFCIKSPGLEITSPDHQDRWSQPRDFVKWFMENYGDDKRLLGIEVMNEPGGKEMPFTKSMLETAKSMQGTVPLTVGTANAQQAEEFIPLGLNIIQFHNNFPRSCEEMEQSIREALALGAKYDLPVWLTEWQWVRPDGSGFGKQKVPLTETTPDYASLAATVQKYPVGNFFWSLMVKRAYLPSQRKNGTVNGLFWPDGSVWSLTDARSIAIDFSLNLAQKKSLLPFNQNH